MATKMANVRMNSVLKEGGDAVLQREGLTFTGIVTALYEYLVHEQAVPECLASAAGNDALANRRRAALRNFTGCAARAHGGPIDVSLDEVRAERLARQ